MSWATHLIAALGRGEKVSFRPRGHSMAGRIEDGQLVELAPLAKDPVVGDIVLCKVRGRPYLHLVKQERAGQYLIGNNRGGTNGWVSRRGIFGLVVRIG